MSRGYLGKISAVVTANTSDLSRKLSGGKREVEAFARSVQSTISSGNAAAGRSFNEIFTPLQKLERALAAASSKVLDLKTDPAIAKVKALVSASEQLAKPLGAAAKQLSSLSTASQGEFINALVSAQKAAVSVKDEIDRLGSVGERRFEAVAAKVDRVVAAANRLKEAGNAVSSLATGAELRFRQPGFLAQTGRAAQLQQQAAALPPEQIQGSAIGSLVGRQRQAAEEAERLLARLERIQVTRRGDAASAQQAYNVQVAALRGVNEELEREIALIQQAAQARQRFAQTEQDRRSGALSRRNAGAFDDATQGILDGRRPRQDVIFGRQEATTSTELQRTLSLWDQFTSQSPEVQAAIEDERKALNNIAVSARDGQASLGALTAANDRMAQSMERMSEANRRAEANSRLVISPDQPPPPVEGFSTRLPRSYLGDRAASDARASLGPDVSDTFRQVDQLGGSITALKGQIAGLSLPLRTELAPEIRRLEETWVRLNARGPAATAEEIENARQETERLSQSLRRANQADALPTFDTFASNASSRRAAAELEALGNILQRVEAEAGGPAAAAFDRLRQRTQEAIRTGTAGLPAVRRELELLQREAAEAAAQTGRISAGGAFREIQRTGDVARGAFGGAGLAIQQAAFAVDDFFSVTGGLDQRIRAAGNNISQLGFILGGTAGLFAGIATSITAQALVALVRFANGGRTAEDQTKALNEALARQKSLVEDLAQAFRSVGDSIERAFSPAAQSGRQFGKELDNIKKKQEEARRGNLGLFDPDVQLQRAEQNRITRQIGQAEDPATILRLQRELATAQRREQALLDGLVAGAPRTPEQRNRAIASLEDAFTNAADTRRNPRPFAREQARANIRVLQGMDAPQQIEALRGQQRYIQIAADRGEISRARADEANLAIEAVIARLEDGTRAAIDELTVNIARAAQNAATSIENAQEDVAEAIRRGVPGAAAFQSALDNSARQLTDAFAQLDAASNIKNQDERDAAVRQAQGRVNDVLMRRDAIAERSRELRLGRTFGGDRTTAALSSLQSNDRFANEMAGMTAVVARAADDEFAARQKIAEAIRDREQAEKGGNAAAIKNAQAREEAARNELEAAQKAGEVASLMAEAALAMEEALGRLRKVVSDAVSQSEGIANDAQQRLNQDPTLENRQDRDRAEQQLISDRERAARAQNEIDASRAEAMSDPIVAGINAELADIDQERKRLKAEAEVNNQQADPRQMQQLADREAALLAERERELLNLTALERGQADAIAQEIAARKKVIDEQIREAMVLKELADRLKNIENPRGDALRGQELSLSPAQRAAQEMAQGAADINAYFDAAADLINPDGIIAGNELERLRQNEVDRNAALERFQQEQARQIAPLLVGFAQEVENALAQGPSRAALGASDSSTLEGQRELNRLLRGDDQNRNVDLAELQRQANALLEAIARNTEDGAPVAN